MTIEAKVENKLGSRVNVCINCRRIAINEIKREEQQKYYGLEELIFSYRQLLSLGPRLSDVTIFRVLSEGQRKLLESHRNVIHNWSDR